MGNSFHENSKDNTMRYIIADSWSHFIEDEKTGKAPERQIRWVFDADENEVSHLEIFQKNAWNSASRNDFANVDDHLKGANPDVIDNPENWGLETSDELPEWAVGPAAQPGMR
jgi:hypothetical protein